MKLKGSKIKTIKENKYLHKCIINLWKLIPTRVQWSQELSGVQKGIRHLYG